MYFLILMIEFNLIFFSKERSAAHFLDIRAFEKSIVQKKNAFKLTKLFLYNLKFNDFLFFFIF